MSGDLMEAPRCRATAKGTGERCKRRPVPGGTVCVMHGGKAPQVKAAAERAQAEAEAEKLLNTIWRTDAEPVVDAVGALQVLAGRLQHAADALGRRIDDGDSLDGPAAIAWTKVLRELRQALVGMERLDLQGKVIALEQERAQLVTAAFRLALAAVGERLLPADRSLMVDVFLRELGAQVVPGQVESGAAS